MATTVENEQSLIPVESIAQSILVLRGRRVILDADLARLYGVTTTRLNEQVRRNQERFPEDFAFQLALSEFQDLKSQFARSSGTHGGRRKAPIAFTEHGALMATTVLKTPRAVEVSLYVVRAFIRLRELLSTHTELSQKVAELEGRLDTHDEEIALLMQAIQQLLSPPPTPERKLGFRLKETEADYILNTLRSEN